MKVSILSNGKITTTQYNNVSVDGKVEVMGGSGIEVETDPIFNSWKDSEYSILQSSVQTNSEYINQTNGRVTALTTSVNELNTTVTTLGNTVDNKANKSDVDANTACITALGNSVNSLNESVIVLGSDIANKADASTVNSLNTQMQAFSTSLDSVSATALCAQQTADSASAIAACAQSEAYSASVTANNALCLIGPLEGLSSMANGAHGFEACPGHIGIFPSYSLCLGNTNTCVNLIGSYIEIGINDDGCHSTTMLLGGTGCTGAIEITDNCITVNGYMTMFQDRLLIDTNSYDEGGQYIISRWIDAPDGCGGFIPVFESLCTYY